MLSVIHWKRCRPHKGPRPVVDKVDRVKPIKTANNVRSFSCSHFMFRKICVVLDLETKFCQRDNIINSSVLSAQLTKVCNFKTLQSIQVRLSARSTLARLFTQLPKNFECVPYSCLVLVVALCGEDL